MTQGIHRSATGFALSALLGTTAALPALAQTPAVQPAPPSIPQSSPSLPPIVPVPPLPPAASSSPASNVSQPSASAVLTEQGYTLGAGDIIRIDLFDTPELVLEPRYSVLLDGSVNLPWIGGVSVQGLTLAKAAEAISTAYSRFIRKPIVTVGLAAPRPLKIGVIGEVNRPGSYIITVIGSESTQASLSQRSSVESGSQWPTVSKAIQTAGGITQGANIRKIEITRPQRSGKSEVISVDLWRFLQEGDLSQDMLLRDGDTVTIPLATDLDAAEATQVASSNFSPELIKVNVVGEVVVPGAVSVRPNTTLNQAILAAGGLKNNRARKTDVELIRLNPNGTVTKRGISLDFAQGLNDKSNPALRNNDVVIVNRNALASVTDFVGAVLSPLSSVFGIFNLLGIRP